MDSRPKSLEVWLNGELVAELADKRGQLPLRYTDAVLSKRRGQPLLSCSLPVSNDVHQAKAFFDGVLPEGRFRNDLAALAGVVATDTFGLLARYGRDIAGAIVVKDPAREPGNAEPCALPLTEDELADEVTALPNRPLGIHDDSELSIPGLQNKMLLIKDGLRWARPVNGAPSTHILKLDTQAHPGVVAAEAEAMQLAKAVGLTSVHVEVERISNIDCIIVERFDRAIDDNGDVIRLHQEDICQALGYPPEQKYELPGRGRPGHGGGPEFADVARLLDTHSAAPLEDLDKLAQVATFTALIGNADAHGKNLALLFTSEHRVRLAPLYDTVPTVLFPKLKNEAAMTIGGAVDLAKVSRTSLAAEARHWNVDPHRMIEQAETLAHAVIEHAPLVLGANSAVGELAEQRATAFLA